MAIPPLRRWIIWLLLYCPFSGLLSCQSSLPMEAVVAPPPGSARSSAPIDSGTNQCPAATSLVAGSVLRIVAQPTAAASYATSDAPTLSTPTSVTAASTSPIPSSSYETATGERVRFFTSGAHWHAIASSQPSHTLPVVSQVSLGPYLRWLHNQDPWTVKGRVHLMPTPTSPAQLCVYVGKAGLLGGGSDSEEDDRKPAAKSHTPPPKRLKTVHTGAHTRALVQLYNDPSTSPSTRAGCADVLRNRIAWFNKEQGSLGTLNAVRGKLIEYADISKIQLCIAGIDDAEKEARKGLLGHYFIDLYNAISEAYCAGEALLLEMLAYSISHIDVAYFQQDMTLLTQLVEKLLGKLTDDVQFYTKDTYRGHVPLLYAVHQSLLRVYDISLDRFNPSQPPYSRFKAKLSEIRDRGAAYYPIRYYARLILQSLVPLELVPSSRKLTSAQWADLTWGFLYMGQVLLKTLGERTMDIDALKNSLSHFRAAYPSIGAIKSAPWYATHQAMHVAALSSTKTVYSASKGHFKAFNAYLAQYEDAHSLQKKRWSNILHWQAHKESHRDFYYGLRSLYQLLGLFGGASSVREESIKALSNLSAVWEKHQDIQAGYLESLAVIAVQSKVAEDRAYAYDKLKLIHFANDSSGLEALLASVQNPIGAPPAGDSWFAIPINPEESTTPPFDMHKASLQAHYLSTYATLPSLFSEDNEEPKAMESLKTSYKLSLVESKDQQAASSRPRLYLKDLFRGTPTSLEAPGALSRVLIVGLPGVGKTTLSKQLAYQWGQGVLWQEAFTYVYVLPIRTLLETLKLQGPHEIWHVPLTLPNAIIKTYYKGLLTDDASYKTLHAQVVGHLSSEATLVVLDGLDEGSGGAQQQELLAAAKASSHKLLLLSRPYGIQDMRASSAREVEHDGLDLAQMRSYVTNNVPVEHTEDLLSLLSEEEKVQEISCVPVNLEILCYLFRHSSATARAGLTASLKQGSLPKLYSHLTEEVWDRYEARLEALSPTSDQKPSIGKGSVFDVLGRLGYEALQREEGEGLTWISREQLKQLLRSEIDVSTRKVPTMLQDTGFLLLRWLDSPGIYEFPHLTFQEYFAGRWLSKQLSSDDKRAKEKAEAFIKEPSNRYAPRYGRMFTFMAGEAMKDVAKRYENLRNLLVLSEEEAPAFNASPVDIRHLAFQLRILNEWAIVSDEAAVEWGLADLSVTRAFDVRATVRGCVQAGIALIKELNPNRLFPVLRATLSSFRGIGSYVMPGSLRCLLEGAIESSGREESKILSEVASITSTIPWASIAALQRLYADDASMRCCIVQALGEVPSVVPTLKERVTTFLDESASRCTDEAVRAAITEARGAMAQLLTCNFITRRLPTNDLVFGVKAWAEYFGEVGAAPDLPDDLEEILDSPCPFFRDKDGGVLLVRETHLLTLIPATVDGAPLTLNLLERLIQSPKNGGHATKYEYYDDDVQQQIGDTPSGGAYWALVTRDILPGSRYKDDAFHKALVAKHGDYDLPSVLEIATSIVCHHVRSGECLLSDAPLTYTRCKDLVPYRGVDYPVVVGGFAPSGLHIYDDINDHHNFSGVVSFRKF